LCVADLYTDSGKSDPYSYCDIHGNAHCDCYDDADVHAYSYGHIHNHAQCYGNGYSYGYWKTDDHPSAWRNAEGASYASGATRCAEINLVGRDRRACQRERTAQRPVSTISRVRTMNRGRIYPIGPVTSVMPR